jgi:Leucine Rich repeat
MRRMMRGILFIAGLGGIVAATFSQEAAPERMPADVVKAWGKAGARPCWLDPGPVLRDALWDYPPTSPPAQLDMTGWDWLCLRACRARGEEQIGDMPGFRFQEWPTGGVADLPQPSRAFGLVLDGKEGKDATLKGLADLKNLQALYLYDIELTNANLKQLAQLKNLRTLGLARTNVTDVCLKDLAALKNLRSLYLNWTQVTGAGLKELAGLKNLQTLGLSCTVVTDENLKEIASLQGLETLHIYNTKVTDAGIEELQKALPSLAISR